jgi:hypothetical protein
VVRYFILQYSNDKHYEEMKGPVIILLLLVTKPITFITKIQVILIRSTSQLNPRLSVGGFWGKNDNRAGISQGTLFPPTPEICYNTNAPICVTAL